MRKVTTIAVGLLAIALLAATSAQANAPRVTRGDAEAIFQAFGNGGWSILLNGEMVDEGAPADFFPDSMARITPMAQWNGRHYCSLDWHVISAAVNEGNPVGGSRTNAEIRESLLERSFLFALDGAPLDHEVSAVKRTTNPERIGAVEAFYLDVGKVMAPEELSVGQHTLQFTGFRPGRPPNVLPPITFFIDGPGTGTCL